MEHIFSIFGCVLSGFIALYAGFKLRQSRGRRDRNDRLTDYWGRGSFTEHVGGYFTSVFWGLISVISGGLFFYILFSLAPKKDSMVDAISPVIQQQKVEQSSSTQPEYSTTTPQKTEPPQEAKKHEFTEEEIRQLEVEKQYSGDDPVIRERLGLPPKTTQQN